MEPNCCLGKAITYMLKHWERLDPIQGPGAPLDNNLCYATRSIAKGKYCDCLIITLEDQSAHCWCWTLLTRRKCFMRSCLAI